MGECEKALKKATADKEQACDRDVPAAEKDLEKAKEVLNVRKKALVDAEKALAKAEQDLEVAKGKLYDAKSNLQYFIDQVWASYLWLCGNENPGDYDNQSYIDPQVQV